MNTQTQFCYESKSFGVISVESMLDKILILEEKITNLQEQVNTLNLEIIEIKSPKCSECNCKLNEDERGMCISCSYIANH